MGGFGCFFDLAVSQDGFGCKDCKRVREHVASLLPFRVLEAAAVPELSEEES